MLAIPLTSSTINAHRRGASCCDVHSESLVDVSILPSEDTVQSKHTKTTLLAFDLYSCTSNGIPFGAERGFMLIPNAHHDEKHTETPGTVIDCTHLIWEWGS